MAQEIKLTKNELRAQQTRLGQLRKYLPTLQLKKAMLQAEVNLARAEISQRKKELDQKRAVIDQYRQLLTQDVGVAFDEAAVVDKVHKRWENIAGVEVPECEGVDFVELEYSLFDTPPWVDAAVADLRKLVRSQVDVQVAEEKRDALERELREVSIRVNLFEKILIPRAIRNIKKIKVFLGDQELAAVSQAKVAKTKIERRKAAAWEAAYAG